AREERGRLDRLRDAQRELAEARGGQEAGGGEHRKAAIHRRHCRLPRKGEGLEGVSLWSAGRDHRDKPANRHIVALRKRRREPERRERFAIQTLQPWRESVSAGQERIQPISRTHEV